MLTSRCSREPAWLWQGGALSCGVHPAGPTSWARGLLGWRPAPPSSPHTVPGGSRAVSAGLAALGKGGREPAVLCQVWVCLLAWWHGPTCCRPCRARGDVQGCLREPGPGADPGLKVASAPPSSVGGFWFPMVGPRGPGEEGFPLGGSVVTLPQCVGPTVQVALVLSSPGCAFCLGRQLPWRCWGCRAAAGAAVRVAWLGAYWVPVGCLPSHGRQAPPGCPFGLAVPPVSSRRVMPAARS